ncbi:hypothetical protein V8C37DRAFT_390489 [Trichoderma ceciliae]
MIIFSSLTTAPEESARSPVELLKAFRDAIKAHQSPYSKGNILHCDISGNNIITDLGIRRSGARYFSKCICCSFEFVRR